MNNQTNQNDPNDRGQIEKSSIFPGLRSIWLGMRDSNPRSRDQNPLPYRLANPHRQRVMVRLPNCRQNKFARHF